jgi:hypothetical protein
LILDLLRRWICFLWGHLKEHRFADPHRTVQDIIARFQAAATTVDSIMLRLVQENTAQRTYVCLEMDGGYFKHLF